MLEIYVRKEMSRTNTNHLLYENCLYLAQVLWCSHSVYKMCVVKQESEIRVDILRLQMIALVPPPNNASS